jgi:hypothetical protein
MVNAPFNDGSAAIGSATALYAAEKIIVRIPNNANDLVNSFFSLI